MNPMMVGIETIDGPWRKALIWWISRFENQLDLPDIGGSAWTMIARLYFMLRMSSGG